MKMWMKVLLALAGVAAFTFLMYKSQHRTYELIHITTRLIGS